MKVDNVKTGDEVLAEKAEDEAPENLIEDSKDEINDKESEKNKQS